MRTFSSAKPIITPEKVKMFCKDISLYRLMEGCFAMSADLQGVNNFLMDIYEEYFHFISDSSYAAGVYLVIVSNGKQTIMKKIVN